MWNILKVSRFNPWNQRNASSSSDFRRRGTWMRCAVSWKPRPRWTAAAPRYCRVRRFHPLGAHWIAHSNDLSPGRSSIILISILYICTSTNFCTKEIRNLLQLPMIAPSGWMTTPIFIDQGAQGYTPVGVAAYRGDLEALLVDGSKIGSDADINQHPL